MRPIARRLITSALSIYVAVSLLGALVLCQIALHPPRRSLEDAASFRRIAEREYGAGVQDVSVSGARNTELRGWFVRPQRSNGNVVIVLHGIADNRLGAAGFASDFLPEGYAVLLPDARAHGASGGAFATYGIIEKDDVRRWIDWLEAKATPRCVYLLGESMGAAIAIQATAADPRICATVAESPFATFREIAYERVGQMTNTGPWLGKTLLRPLVEMALMLARARTGVWLTEANPLRAIQQTRTPVLLIHGAADTNISPENSRQLWNAARDHAQLWIVPRAEHTGASAVQPDEFRRRVLEWFAAHDEKSHPAAGRAAGQ